MAFNLVQFNSVQSNFHPIYTINSVKIYTVAVWHSIQQFSRPIYSIHPIFYSVHPFHSIQFNSTLYIYNLQDWAKSKSITWVTD